MLVNLGPMCPAIPPSLSRTALLLCVACAAGAAPFDFSAAPDASLPAALEDKAVTRHQITLGGTTLPYTATAGHLTVAAPGTRTPEAAVFYAAYTADGKAPSERPVTFLYNGGPGSASVWLHLGSFGPRRLVTGDPATTQKAPFPLVDNQESLLDTTDLVFVDAVGTGLSEAVAPNTNQTFWGVDADAAVFRDFVRRYLAVNGRLGSPAYLFGESYGTPRTAVTANLLGAAGIRLAGVILQSSILNYNTNGAAGPDISCAGFLPSYGAVGAYYRLDVPQPTDLKAFVRQMRVFTAGTYAPALQAWLGDGTPAGADLLARLHDTTGIGVSLWEQQLNLQPDDFQQDLLPDTLIGRYDARVSAPAGSVLAGDGDPSSTFISQSFRDTIGPYLSGFLGYPDGADYTVMNTAANESWDFSHDGLSLPDTIPDLAAALKRRSGLKVLSLNGYHDLATPFYQTELDLARLGRQPNLQIRHYEGGHMVYLDDTSRPLEKGDLVAFYQGAPGWDEAPDHPAAGPGSSRPAWFPVPPEGLRAAGPNLLTDPFVPPAKRRPAAGTETTGAALEAQVERKLREPGK